MNDELPRVQAKGLHVAVVVSIGKASSKGPISILFPRGGCGGMPSATDADATGCYADADADADADAVAPTAIDEDVVVGCCCYCCYCCC